MLNQDFTNIARAAEFLVDEKTGIVQFVEEVRKDPGGPNFFHYAAKASNTKAFTTQENFCDTGGASINRQNAAAKALGEAVERYCSAIYQIEDNPLSTYRQAKFNCVEPEAFALYSQQQYEQENFQWAEFTKDSPVRWTEAVDYLTGESIFVPAARVYIPYTYYRGSGDTPIDQPISTGLACHGNFEKAAIGGLCEVVERDAVSICWQAKISPPQIRIETLDDENYDIVKRFESTGSKVVMFDITLDHGIPTILSVILGDSDSSPAMVVAAASAISPAVAAKKSLEELAHSRRYCQFVRVEMPRLEAVAPDFSAVKDQLTHLNFYVDYNNLPFADFLFQSQVRIDFDEMRDYATGNDREDLQRLTEMVHSVGERVLIKDLTTDDVAIAGLSVARVVIPGFHPIHMGFVNRSLGGKRLWTVPQKMNYPGVQEETGDNPAPHPYP